MTKNEMPENKISKPIPPFVFFGGPEISIDFLNVLEQESTLPTLIVTTPDQPSGRKMKLTSPPLKTWADMRGISVLQPSKLRDISDELTGYDLFVVVAYGKIIPQSILDIPAHGSINLHPSLLPKYRGPSPILSALLADDKKTGISIMLLHAEMDHGPLLAQHEITVDEWMDNRSMEQWFASVGASLFLTILPQYINGDVEVTEQDHAQATECKKFIKSDMELDLSNQRDSYLKYLAFEKPFFFHDEQRIIVTDAEYIDNNFIIKKVIPAGKKEQDWQQFSTT